MNEDKEYVKIEIGTFYRFVETLEIFVACSEVSKENYNYLMERFRDFEYEVLHDGELRDES